jgi:hypothetical protein
MRVKVKTLTLLAASFFHHQERCRILEENPHALQADANSLEGKTKTQIENSRSQQSR